jgi:ABC-type sugar transport system permease subunit
VEERRPLLLLLVMPALAMVLALFVYPLLYSLVSAFTAKNGAFGFDNFIKTFDLYGTDILFTMVIVTVSTVLIGIFAALIGGYLVLGEHPIAVAALKWLYRWPLFIPFIVAAQCMRTFLAKERHAQQRARYARRHRRSKPVGASRLAGHHRHLRMEGDAVCRAARLRRDGGTRPL